jgi:hypothetical protein
MRSPALVGLLLGALPGAVLAQREAPLLKTDLIALLSSPVIPVQEVAALVRRNCLAFRPTERDLADMRSLGASADVVASVTGCAPGQGARAAAGAGTTPAAPPLEPAVTTLQVVVRQPRVVAAAGSEERVAVLAARGGIPQPGERITLLGSGGIEGASGTDISAVTDDSGFAIFPVKVGRRLFTYRLEVAPANGGALPGRPMIDLVVRPGPPASAYVEPREVVFDQGLDSIVPISVAVRDSVGNAVVGESVVLGGNAEGTGFRPDTATTDVLGRARLFVGWDGARRGGTLQVKVGGRQLAWVDVVVGTPLAEAETGFLPGPTRGEVGTSLGGPLVFQARTRLGRPAAGRPVAFRAVNAIVAPATVTTDSEGWARVEVTLGDRIGPAVIAATIDSLEKQVTFQVGPGPAAELVLEHNGTRVDGRWLVVGLDSTFTVRVRARDARGNATIVAGLAAALRQTLLNSRLQLARLVSIQEEPTAVALTFKAIQPGRATFKLVTQDMSTFVWLDVVLQLR